MKNKLDESKAYFEKWLGDKEAEDVKVIDDNDSITPYCYHVQGIVDGRLCYAMFYINLYGKSGINLNYKGPQGKDLTAEEFKKILDSIEIRKRRRELEIIKVGPDQEVLISHRMCEETKEMCTFATLMQK